jgi:RNA binding exosome subunit
VLQSCKAVCPDAYLPNITFTTQKLMGHHRNPITLLRAQIKDPTIIRAFITNFSLNLNVDDKKLLYSKILQHIDQKGALHLRLDKQEAFSGQIRFGQADPIRIKIKLSRSFKSLQETISFYHALNLIMNE